MAESSVHGMYKVQPLYDCFQVLDLPTCMYKVENIHGDFSDTDIKEKPDVTSLENYQIEVLEKLEHLKENITQLKNALGIFDKPVKFQDIVISANPEFPPLSVWYLYYLIGKKMKVGFTTHVHSSLKHMPEIAKQLKTIGSEKPYDLSLTIIWKHAVSEDPSMMVNPINQGVIEGEVNIARYIARLVNFNYEEDAITSTQIDGWLEMIHSSMIHGNAKERQATLRSMNSHLGRHNFLVGNAISIADIVMWSAIIQTKLQKTLPSNVNVWWESLNNSCMFQVPPAMSSG